MKWVVVVARVLVGLPFLVFGLNYFLQFMPPPPSFTGPAQSYIEALGGSGYMNVVKVLEITGGVLLLSGRLVPFGLVLLTPVAVNIALFDVLLVGKPALGVILTALCFFLVWAYRSHFAPLFAWNPKIG